ncbi:hypothetical protein H8E88_35850 [candidate division KSB1 bacterium]|nr:hypothetical protein [candidate division KSB1 bacterium]
MSLSRVIKNFVVTNGDMCGGGCSYLPNWNFCRLFRTELKVKGKTKKDIIRCSDCVKFFNINPDNLLSGKDEH